MVTLFDPNNLVDELVDRLVLGDRLAAVDVPSAVEGVESDPLEDGGIVGARGSGCCQIFDALGPGAAAVDADADFGEFVGFGEAVLCGLPAAAEEVNGPVFS